MLLQMALFHFFLFLCLSTTPLYTTSSQSIHLDIWVVSILAIVNSATMSMEVHTSFWINIFVFFGYIPRSGNVESYGSSAFSFLILFSIVAAPIYISTNSVRRFPFLQMRVILNKPWLLCVLSLFSRVRPFETLWTVAQQAPLSMGFSRQEY